jgi:ribosomal protein S18 acetylase RimI-like enzyme
MAMVPWSDEQKAAFLGWQFDAQTAHYREAYDAAGFFVVERDGAAIGRLYLDRRDDDIRIVDIALVPEAREGGVGTSLIRDVLEEGARSGRSVSIHVESFNPALRLYERLGFREIDTNGVYKLMKWTGTMSSRA